MRPHSLARVSFVVGLTIGVCSFRNYAWRTNPGSGPTVGLVVGGSLFVGLMIRCRPHPEAYLKATSLSTIFSTRKAAPAGKESH